MLRRKLGNRLSQSEQRANGNSFRSKFAQIKNVPLTADPALITSFTSAIRFPDTIGCKDFGRRYCTGRVLRGLCRQLVPHRRTGSLTPVRRAGQGMRPQPGARTRHQPDTSLVEPRGARRTLGSRGSSGTTIPGQATSQRDDPTPASNVRGVRALRRANDLPSNPRTHSERRPPFNLAISLPRLSPRWLSLAGP